MRLTKTVLDSAKYQGGTDYRWDSVLPSFGLRVYPSGKKSFVVSYRMQGRKRIMVLGRYGVLTLNQARTRARKVLAQASDGGDPSGARQALLEAPTVSDLANRYMADHSPKKKASSVREDSRMWKLHILSHLGGSRKVVDVSREEIDRLHSKMRDTPYAANRVLALLSKAFNLAEVWGWRPDASNPCRHVKPFKEEKRERYLSAAEITRLGAVLVEAEQERVELPGVIAAIRLLLLTGCRLNEILSLRWQDVDLERNCLRIDGKNGKRMVLLGRGALAVFTGIEQADDNPYVIQGKNVGKHLVNLNKPWRRIRERAGIEDVRLHDLRHSFASVGAGLGLSLPLIGKMLGHSQPATTARYAHLANDPVRRAVDMVGGEIEAALNGGETA